MRIGDTVIYVESDQTIGHNGTHVHPAIVTRVWEEDNDSPLVNLCVLFDGLAPMARTSVQHHVDRATWIEDGHEHHGAYYLKTHEHFIEG